LTKLSQNVPETQQTGSESQLSFLFFEDGAPFLGERRFSLPNSKVMIHQPLGGTQGQATEIEIHAREILKTREQLNRILSERTGQPMEKIERDTERDYYLSADESKEYGLIDQVISKRP